jgi:hypothetical protein
MPSLCSAIAFSLSTSFALIGVAGETITYYKRQLQRGHAAKHAFGSYTIKASVRQYRAREIAGLVQQCHREVRIAAADLSFTPRLNDQVVIGGKTYQVVSVNTRNPFSEAAIYIVQVRGGNG